MKKVILIALSLVLALGCVSSFAFFGLCDQEACPVGGSINDVNETSGTNTIRNDFTPSRGLPNCTSTAVWYDTETDPDADGIYAKASSTTFMGTDGVSGDDCYFSVDLKATKLGDFCGVVFDETVVSGNNAAILESLSVDELMVEGYGFTLVDANTIKVFINGSTSYYVTYTLGFDASADWHTYSLIKEYSDITITVDNCKLCTIDFSKGEIKSADGTVVCNGFSDITDGEANVCFAILGDDIDVDFDNVGLCDALEEYEFDGDAEATLVESSNPVDPAAATEEPVVTEAPATEEPVVATEEPAAATEAPAEEETSGCGSIIGAGAVLVLAACAIVCKKKD